MREQGITTIVPCLSCGALVERRLRQVERGSGRVFCSLRCLADARKKRYQVSCQQCGTVFERATARVGKARWCSRDCQKAATRSMARPGVYAIRHVPSGRVYVGGTNNVRHRWKAHRTELNGRRHLTPGLQAAWIADGDAAFTWEVLEWVEDIAVLREREQHWMDRLGATDPTRGFNSGSAVATFLGRKHTDAWKAERRAHALAVTAPMRRSMTEEQAIVAAYAVEGGASASMVARAFGVGVHTILRIRSGFCYKHLDLPRKAT